MAENSLASLVTYTVNVPEVFQKNRPYYVLHADGVYRYIHTGAIKVVEKFRTFNETDLPFLPVGKEGVFYDLPKVPFKYLIHIIDFFKAVYDKYRTEASAIVYHFPVENEGLIPNELLNQYCEGFYREGDNDFIIYCPMQNNSSIVTWFAHDEVYQWLNDNAVRVAEWHSHHVMDAFWSTTDRRNQKDLMYYGVIGHINSEDILLFKYVLDGEIYNLPVSTVFEFPLVKEQLVKSVSISEGYEDILQLNSESEKVNENYKDYEGVLPVFNEFPTNWLGRCTSDVGFDIKEELMEESGDDIDEGDEIGEDDEFPYFQEVEQEDTYNEEVEEIQEIQEEQEIEEEELEPHNVPNNLELITKEEHKRSMFFGGFRDKFLGDKKE